MIDQVKHQSNPLSVNLEVWQGDQAGRIVINMN
jgi:hypothetical protein